MDDTNSGKRTRVERSTSESTQSNLFSRENSNNVTTNQSGHKRKLPRKESVMSEDQLDEVDGIFVDGVYTSVAETSLAAKPVLVLSEGEKTELFVQHELQDNYFGDKLNGQIMTTTESIYTVHLFKDLETSDTAILYSKLGIREDDYLISFDSTQISYAIPSVGHADVINLFKNLPMGAEHEMVILRRSEALYYRIKFIFRGVVGNPIEKTVVDTLNEIQYTDIIMIVCPRVERIPKSLRYTENTIQIATRTNDIPEHQFHFKLTKTQNAGEDPSPWRHLKPEVQQEKCLYMSENALSLQLTTSKDDGNAKFSFLPLDDPGYYQIKARYKEAGKILQYIDGKISLIDQNSVKEENKNRTIFSVHRRTCTDK